MKFKGISFRYENWELGFAYYMKYTRDAYSGDGELKFVLEDESDVPDWQLRVREIDETLRLMDDELETNSGSEFFAWMAATLNKLKNVARG